MSENLAGVNALKAVFRNHASGVAILTGTENGEPFGFTATSVTSLGSNPPLVSFNVARGASSYPKLKIGKMLALHALGEDNLELAVKLAGDKEQRFKDVEFNIIDEVPVFSEANAVLLMKVRAVFEVESNAVVICDAVSGFEFASQSPLLYHQRGYIRAGNRLKDNS